MCAGVPALRALAASPAAKPAADPSPRHTFADTLRHYTLYFCLLAVLWAAAFVVLLLVSYFPGVIFK